MQTDVQAEDKSPSGWFERRIEKLHSAPEGSDLRTELEDIFTDNAHIILNHKPISISDFHAHFVSRHFAVVGEAIDWKHVVDGKADDEGEEKERTTSTGAGTEETVAGSYVITRSLKFRIRAGPAQRKSHVVFSAKVKKDPTQAGGGRKISELYMTMVDKAVPISFPHLSNMRVE